ncbi:peptidase S16 [Deinococcus psychrotolerans]|uniref:Peptidase S16 n=1 Tax=Deinococcus psychrotolerans TaxID=2489213 RepID=A0A3G8Y941_9DEIO|nr:LON peptidase substrate-binding domain-containing protein [Deinococcus psychrotolerans]AZI41470.1 peptidase S16 [Deinococcus psychrotolerans]
MVIPLFPLPQFVLFPGQVVPLYVFEERYRSLLARVQRSGEAFGMLQILTPSTEDPRPLESRLSAIGTLAHLRDVAPHEDGTSSITVVGGERFQIRELVPGEEYLLAEIELLPLEEDPSTQAPAIQRALTNRLVTDLLRLHPAEREAIVRHAPPEPLLLASFASVLLPLSGEERQQVLEAATLTDRLETLIGLVPVEARELN